MTTNKRPSEHNPDWMLSLRIWAAIEHPDQLCCCVDRWRACPHPDGPDVPLLLVGRCRSGNRWFWTVREYSLEVDDIRTDGRADTEADAVDAIAAAVVRHLNGRAARLSRAAQHATSRLKDISKAKRAERIAAKPASTDTNAAPVEYLHSLSWWESDDWSRPGEWDRKTYRITRKTAKRVYYRKDGYYNDEGFVDRQVLERDGKVELRFEYTLQNHRTLYVEPPPIPERRRIEAPDLSKLRQAMADAHPDRGGSREEFEPARAAYLRAKRVSA